MNNIFEITLTIWDKDGKILSINNSRRTDNIVHALNQFNMALIMELKRIYEKELDEFKIKNEVSDDIPF